jgi:hypothetical protein
MVNAVRENNLGGTERAGDDQLARLLLMLSLILTFHTAGIAVQPT